MHPTDILRAVVIALRCNECGGEYEVPLAEIVLSQDMLHEGCDARGPEECPPLPYAVLFDRAPIEELQQVWQRLGERAHSVGGRLVLREVPPPTTATGTDPGRDSPHGEPR